MIRQMGWASSRTSKFVTSAHKTLILSFRNCYWMQIPNSNKTKIMMLDYQFSSSVELAASQIKIKKYNKCQS